MSQDKVNLRTRQGDRSLLDIALAVHGAVHGSVEMSYEQEQERVEILKDAVKFWHHPSHPRTASFDYAVLYVIREAIRESDDLFSPKSASVPPQ